MALVRQLPSLYLRGSVANLTMANLTPEEQQDLERKFTYVVNHPELGKHKTRVMREFGITIRADYSDDRANAEQEFNVAVWRGLVSIFYHRNYAFRCTHCDSSTYLTQRGKPKAFDRIQTPCPHCKMAVIDDPGCTEYQTGDIVNHAELRKKFEHIGFGTPTFKSTIVAIPGDKKYQNPDEIINCPKQLKQFFGEFVWNYFRQQIKENSRKEHNKTPVEITGPADEILVEQIISLCTRLNIDINRQKKIAPLNGVYSIKLIGLVTSPEFSIELALLRVAAEAHDVKMVVSAQSIDVIVNPSAPFIKASVVQPEHVTVLDNQLSPTNDEEANIFTVNQISYRTIRGEHMDQDDHVMTTDLCDAAKTVRLSLPDGDCRDIYDIYCQVGPLYESFSDKYGVGQPKINHVAEFLKITARAVKIHRETIKVQCLAFDLVPETVS